MANGTSTIEAFLQELSQYLHLTKSVILKQGGQINVDENFTVRFTLTNTAPVGRPLIRFKKPRLQLLKTVYARPIMPDGSVVDGLGADFPDTTLEPGEATTLDIPMLATADIAGWTDIFIR